MTGRRRMHGAAPAGLLALALAAALAGCAGEPAPAVTVTAVVTETATPIPVPVPTQTVVVTAEPVPEVPVEPTIDPNAPVAEPETAYAVDLGAREGAGAAPTLDADGTIVSYKVIEKDTFFDIAQRFDIPVQQLLTMNPRVTDVGTEIYINQIINLDARTLPAG